LFGLVTYTNLTKTIICRELRHIALQKNKKHETHHPS
jgi:hypothetical protein